MQGTYEGCWEQSWQGQPGACLQYSEGVCISHYTGAPMCMDTASECTRELPYCNPEGCAEGMCTCMPVPNPPIFDNVHCSSSCIEGDCDACCGCDCGAEWAASDMDIPAAASIACGRNTTTACAGTQPDFLPFSYADFADIVDINWGSFTPEVVSQTCASPSSTYPDGLGPARAATTEAECERWAQLSGGTYGGLLPADIYGCYRPATHVPLQSAEKGVYADHDPQAPWYFSNTGNGAPSTYTGGQCSANAAPQGLSAPGHTRQVSRSAIMSNTDVENPLSKVFETEQAAGEPPTDPAAAATGAESGEAHHTEQQQEYCTSHSVRYVGQK